MKFYIRTIIYVLQKHYIIILIRSVYIDIYLYLYDLNDNNIINFIYNILIIRNLITSVTMNLY